MSQHLAVLRRDELVATRKKPRRSITPCAAMRVREMIGLLHRLYCSDPNKNRH